MIFTFTDMQFYYLQVFLMYITFRGFAPEGDIHYKVLQVIKLYIHEKNHDIGCLTSCRLTN